MRFKIQDSGFRIQDLGFKNQRQSASKRSRLGNYFFVAFFLLLTVYGSQITVWAQKARSISEVQGDKNASAFAGETVRVSGIVTARTRSGFFIQTPDDKTDNNPNTSEGIYVFSRGEPGGEATIGNLVTVSGTIEEFRPKQEPLSLPITEISMQKGKDTISVESKANLLPKPVVLSLDIFKDNRIDALEKYEGMRVTVAEMTVVAPTNGRVDEKTGASTSDGTFYGVVKGLARPLREPGLDVYDYVLLPDKEKEKLKKDFPKISLFDHNPERLRVESTAQLGAQAIDVTSFAEIKNVTGVLHYTYRAYTIYTDADNRPAISNLVKAQPLPAPNERQFSIAAMNLERLFDEEDDPNVKEAITTVEGFEKRLRKVSLAIRTIMQMPDVVGIVEIENLTVLKRLAERINKDAEASGKPNPKYEAYLVEGNDVGGIDSGFLVKSSRVETLETKQFGKDEQFQNPVSKKDVFLNDRPPFFLRAAIKDPKNGQPFEFVVIVNHLKSLRGYNDEKDAPFVRMKKRLQAEFLAKFVAERQKANPNERIALVGDFNAFQFDDGVMDVIGTIKGKPAAKEQVMIAAEDLINPDMINLVDVIKADQRYSYSFDGNAQVLDHFLVSESFKKHINGFGFARINADFPEVYRNDATRVERFSDHDAAVAYFTFDDVTTPKVK
jgi:predicted extracellular nuclease